MRTRTVGQTPDLPNNGRCADAYLSAGLYVVSSGGNRQLTYDVRIEGRAKRRLGALGRRVNHCHERTQIIRLGVWGLPAG